MSYRASRREKGGKTWGDNKVIATNIDHGEPEEGEPGEKKQELGGSQQGLKNRNLERGEELLMGKNWGNY